MKIFVVGANGQIGRYLIKDLAPSSHEIFAGVRDVASQTLVKKENVSYVSFDLTWSVEKMTEAFKGIDVLIFAAGSQGKNLLQVDLDGAIKTVIAAENAHVSRYLMVSAVYADELVVQEITLDQLPETASKLLAGTHQGRTLVNVGDHK